MALSFLVDPKKRYIAYRNRISTKRMDLTSRTLAENGFKVESVELLPSERSNVRLAI